jgi:hypothetical protein
MRSHRALAFLIVPLALVATAPAAWAYFSSQGSGQGTVAVGSLPAPTGVTAIPAGGTVDVAWTGITPPGGAGLGYYVTRTPVPAAATVDVCGSPGAPLARTITACTDTLAPAGTYSYRVVATYTTWTSTSAANAVVSVGRATTTTALELSAPTTTFDGEQGLTVTVSVNPQVAADPTGTVIVATGATTLCTITLPDTSCSPGPTTLSPSGTAYPVTATYAGDGEFSGSASGATDLTVYDAPVITNTSLAAARAGETGYSQTLVATGGFGALTWSTSTGVLPFGLQLDNNTGVLSGTFAPGDTTRTMSITATDANGGTGTQSFTITVTNPYVRQSTSRPAGTNATFNVNLVNGVTAGDALVMTLAQGCATTTGTAVDSHVTGVSGDSITWTRAVATGCGPDGDAEVWYGLATTTAAPGARVAITLNAAADVPYASVTEYTGVTGWDSTSGATSGAGGSGASVGSAASTPASTGELVVGGAYVTRATPSSLAGLVGPFVPLNTISPNLGLGIYAVDATTAPLTLTYTQTVGGVPTAGPWSAVITAFTLAP